jgi:DNA polymerase-3 subunit alpha
MKLLQKSGIYELLDDESPEDKPVRVCGIIASRSDRRTKKGTLMSTLVLEDLYASVEVLVFSAQLTRLNEVISEGARVCVDGTVSREEDGKMIIILREAYNLDELKTPSVNKVFVRVSDESQLSSVLSVTGEYKGNTPLCVYFADSGHVVQSDKDNCVNPTNELIAHLVNTFGDGAVAVK